MTTNTIESRELCLVACNDQALYLAIKGVFPTLAKHYVNDNWNKDKACKAIYNVLTAWTSKEGHNLGLLGWKPSRQDRELASVELFEHYAEELTEYIQAYIGKPDLFIVVANFSHDTSGNPTAYHYVLGYPLPKRHNQVGYSDYLDGCQEAIAKAIGKKEAGFYHLHHVTGSRSEDCLNAHYKQVVINLD